MHDLRELQHDFVQALREPAATARVATWLAGDPAAIARGLAIYRANLAATAARALTAAFPVLRQLLGGESFAALAAGYRQAHPSASGDLAEFGADLARFAAGFEPTRTLPWLPDLARLEWAAHQAYGAADAEPWDPAPLAAIAPADHARLRFAFAPGLAVIESRWPIARLWTIHQPDHANEFAVDWEAAETALVAREGLAVTVRAIGAGDAAFLARSLRGAPLGDATDAALAADPAFDPGALLAGLLAAGVVCGAKLRG